MEDDLKNAGEACPHTGVSGLLCTEVLVRTMPALFSSQGHGRNKRNHGEQSAF